MYKKNKMLSAIAAVAILSSGAMSFDMVVKSNDKNSATIMTDITNDAVRATYTDANIVTASEPMRLSTNDKGDALIYPSFKAKEGWETKITVRNTRDVAVVAKAVLYDAYDSHELKDFNLYLSSHDVASFKIKSGDDSKNTAIVTTRDGSIMAGLDQTLTTDSAVTVKHEDPANTELANISEQLDADGDFIIATTTSFADKNKDKSGYVIIYVMAQTDDKNSTLPKNNIGHDYYHQEHVKLYQAYYRALTECRGNSWKDIFNTYGTAKNGTAIELNITAPNVNANCDDSINTHFTSPDKDILFGEVSMYKGGSDPRSLLLKARAIENYTDDSVSQMMLWAPGEYASIQDRRITKDIDGDTYADYNTTGIYEDSKDMVVKHGYFSFNKHKTKNDRSVLLVTQPMKRALDMAGYGSKYWTKLNIPTNWGQFSLGMQFYDENENADKRKLQLVTITSPANAKDAKLYEPEMAPLNYDLLARGANQQIFKDNATTGYADIKINGNKGLPAIVTEMVSEDINGEAQINWIYSATNK